MFSWSPRWIAVAQKGDLFDEAMDLIGSRLCNELTIQDVSMRPARFQACFGTSVPPTPRRDTTAIPARGTTALGSQNAQSKRILSSRCLPQQRVQPSQSIHRHVRPSFRRATVANEETQTVNITRPAAARPPWMDLNLPVSFSRHDHDDRTVAVCGDSAVCPK